MTTLMKRRKKRALHPFESRLLTPWSNNLIRPWSSSLFPSNFANLARFDDVFDDEALMPAINVQEHDKDFEIEFAVPGFSKKDFEVTIEKDLLNVCGKKELEEEVKEDDYSRREFSYESFEKSMLLPPSVDLDQDIKASYKNGILKIKLLKKETAIIDETPKKVIEVS